MRALSLALVIIMVSSIFGLAHCSKPPSVVTLPTIVESISPANKATGVEPDATITINFKSLIWTSQLPAARDGEPLSFDSTELADRFRITDAATGEMVEGTVTIEDGVKLTFELPAGESWKPHTAYWIEGAANTSLDEARREGCWEELFFSEFTTEDLEEDEFPVNHPFPGGWPDLLNDIAYDVDTSQSLSFEELETRIKSAQSMAKEANAQNQLDYSGIIYFPNEDETVEVGQYTYDFVTKFHFWPNIINLTEVYYSEDDHALFNDILDQLLENEPNKAQLKSDITAQIERGDRVFSACDFITSLWYGFVRFTEVYYGMLINLDNPDKTATRRPYVQEILVHDYADYGLPCLHDPHTEELADMFNDSAAFAIGASWDLCLRGNLKKNKYHAIIVDKLAEAPEAEFYIVRVHLNCFCNPFYDGPDSVPVPWIPIPTPNDPVPEPVWEPQPFPNPSPPKNPKVPPNPQPDPDPANRPVPYPLPPDMIPLPQEDPLEPPVEKLEPPDEEEAPEGCEQPPIDCSDNETAGEKLADTIEKYKVANATRSADIEKFKGLFDHYDLKLAWLYGIEGVTFNDPCLNELLKKLLEDIQPLLEQREALGKQMNDIAQQIKDIKESDPVLEAFRKRGEHWSNMIQDFGSWSQIRVRCPTPVIFSGGLIKDIRLTPEMQETFQKAVQAALMVDDIEQQKTLQQAVNEAVRLVVAAHRIIGEAKDEGKGKSWSEAVEEVPKGKDSKIDGLYGLNNAIWESYGKCLEELHREQFSIFLKGMYGGRINDDQLKQMINVMINGWSALTEDGQRKKYQDMQDEVKALQAKQAELAYEMAKLGDQINEKKQAFLEKADRCCFPKSLQNNLRLRQTQKILESYLEWCGNRTPKFDIALIPGYWAGRYEEYIEGSVSRLCAVLCKIMDDEEFPEFNGLRSYAAWIYNCFCWQYKCEDIVKPCDPECEDCDGHPTDITPTPDVDVPGILLLLKYL